MQNWHFPSFINYRTISITNALVISSCQESVFFSGQDQMARDFSRAFVKTNAEMNTLFDVTFLVGDKACKSKKKLFGVRAILGVRSRVFQEF